MAFIFRCNTTTWILGTPYESDALEALSDTEEAAILYKAALADPTHRLVVDIADITAFTAKSGPRKDNDRLNTCRERLLAASQHIPPAFFEDGTHGSFWKEVITQWNDCLNRVRLYSVTTVTTETSPLQPEIAWLGGRKHKYDFEVTFRQPSDGAIMCRAALEFKHNSESLYKLPQFLSIPAKPGVFVNGEGIPGYAEFFYDRFLSAYLACDAGAPVCPERSVYLKHVYTTDAKCHSFFTTLKARKETESKAKTAVVHASIAAYLEEYVGSFDVASFIEKIRRTQEDKQFVLWSPETGDCSGKGRFVLESERFILPDSVWSSACLTSSGIKRNNTVVVNLPTDPQERAFHALLRWRNGLGILMPAWQIKVVSGAGTVRRIGKSFKR